jgi:hypothetical protein
LRFAPRWAEPVKQREPEYRQSAQRRPAEQREKGRLTFSGEAEIGEHQRQHDDCGDREQQYHDGAEREAERDHVEPDEAALFVFVVNDIQRIEDRLHAGVRAPERETEADYEGEGQFSIAVRGDTNDLLTDQVVGAGRQQAGDKAEMRADRACLREQPVERHQRGDRRHDGEHGVKRHAGSNQQQPIRGNLLVRAPQDVLPSAPRDAQRRRGLPAAARLHRALCLQGARLVGRTHGSGRGVLRLFPVLAKSLLPAQRTNRDGESGQRGKGSEQ